MKKHAEHPKAPKQPSKRKRAEPAKKSLHPHAPAREHHAREVAAKPSAVASSAHSAELLPRKKKAAFAFPLAGCLDAIRGFGLPKSLRPYAKGKTLLLLGLVIAAIGAAVVYGHHHAADALTPAVTQANEVANEAVKKVTPAPTQTFAQWCLGVGGFMHHAELCEVQIKRMWGRNRQVVVDSWWDTNLEVKANDTVEVSVAEGRPKMLLGKEELAGVKSGVFVAKSDGTLSFASRDMRAGFDVREVTAKRCYDPKGQTPRCPKFAPIAAK